MTRDISHAQFLSLVYHDLFDYPLTREELLFWQIGGEVAPKHEAGLLGAFHYLPGRSSTVLSRTNKTKANDKKYLKALKAAKVIQRIPSCQMVAISGALAMGNAKKEDDIDLFIVTSVDCLWITRLVAYVLLKFAGISVRRVGDTDLRDKICLNLWVDEKHLSVPTRDIYSAHEVLQAKVLFDRGGIYRKFLAANRWVEQFFPNGYSTSVTTSEIGLGQKLYSKGTSSAYHYIAMKYLHLFETPARLIQWHYMRNKRTREKVGRGFAFFHPKSWRELIIRSFLRRLEGMLVGQHTSMNSTISN